MLDTNFQLYNIKDVCIIHNAQSYLSIHETDPYITRIDTVPTLPIFTYPSSDIVNLNNIHIWQNNKIIPIIPSDIDFDIRIEYILKHCWVELTYTEFNTFYSEYLPKYHKQLYAKTLNIAIKSIIGFNGVLLNKIKEAFNLANSYNIRINSMIGPIYDPKFMDEIKSENEKFYYNNKQKINNILIDYIRIGPYNKYVSHYGGLATILNHINKNNSSFFPYIIADSNEITTYTDIVTALALGANYVMCNNIFTSLLDSAAKFSGPHNFSIYKILYINDKETEDKKLQFLLKHKQLYKNNSIIPCTQTITQWATSFTECLQTFMAECCVKNVKDFCGNVHCQICLH